VSVVRDALIRKGLLPPEATTTDHTTTVVKSWQFEIAKAGVNPFAVVTKADGMSDCIYGWASVAATADGESVIDAHGDEIPIEELESAAMGHMLTFGGQIGQSHTGDAKGKIFESVVFTPEKLVSMGLAPDALPSAWWIGAQVDDPTLMAGVRDGTYRSFSIQGLGQYELDEVNE
jgi:hypothetical protein